KIRDARKGILRPSRCCKHKQDRLQDVSTESQRSRTCEPPQSILMRARELPASSAAQQADGSLGAASAEMPNGKGKPRRREKRRGSPERSDAREGTTTRPP